MVKCARSAIWLFLISLRHYFHCTNTVYFALGTITTLPLIFVISNKMKKLLFILGFYLVKKYCQHKNKHFIRTDYPDMYHEYFCHDCQLKVFDSFDN